MDFASIMPGIPKARVASRIVMAPQHAKKLMYALKDNIEKFEQLNGAIPEDKPQGLPIHFNGPAGEA